MSLRRVAMFLAAAAILAPSQTGGAASPAFEVASLKPSGPRSIRGSAGGPESSDPGLYRFSSASLLDLIAIAYNVDFFQISSPAPLDRKNFDLVAKVPDGATKPQFRAMMQNLLAERFHLKLHLQSKEFPAYELVLAKTGPKFREMASGILGSSARKDGWPDLPPNRPGIMSRHSMSGGLELVRLKSQQEPISAFAGMLRRPDDLPIIDKTGLTGKYDFTFEYTRALPNSRPNGATDPPLVPDLFTALERQLGLQLVHKKLPFDVVIVDSVDRLPSEN
jgi:uncharacterized protein (TIGR03435 family)